MMAGDKFMNTDFTAYLGLGSNLGDRLALLAEAVDHLCRHENIAIDLDSSLSSIYKTSPVGVTEIQQDYYNAAVRIETSLKPVDLLHACIQIENQMGRVRNERNGSRVIDIDLLMVEDVVMETDLLTLPHPRMHERLFVLIPLREIATDAIHPTTGKSIRTLHDELLRSNENEKNLLQREHVELLHIVGWFQFKDEIVTKV